MFKIFHNHETGVITVGRTPAEARIQCLDLVAAQEVARALNGADGVSGHIPQDMLHVRWKDGLPIVTVELGNSPRVEAALVQQLDGILDELRHALNGKDTDTAISIAHGIGVAAEIVASRKKLLESGQAS